MQLAEIVSDFAVGMMAADALEPQAKSHRREGVLYRRGIGPFSEDEAVRLTLEQMKIHRPGIYEDARRVRYPEARTTCDLGLGDPLDWAIEVHARAGREG